MLSWVKLAGESIMEYIFKISECGKIRSKKNVIALLIFMPLMSLLMPVLLLNSEVKIPLTTIILITIGFIAFFETMVLIIGYVVIRGNKKRQLIINEEGAFASMMCFIKFDNIKEVLIKRNKENYLIGISLVDNKDTVHFIGGYERQEEILQLIQSRISSEVEVIERKENFDLKSPYKNFVNSMGKGCLLYVFMMIVLAGSAMIIIVLPFSILSAIEVTTPKYFMLIMGGVYLGIIIIFLPVIKKWIRRKFY